MTISFRTLATSIMALGLALGLTFAGGVAWGRTSVAETVVTEQVQSAGSSQLGGGAGQAGTQGRAAGQGGQGAAGRAGASPSPTDGDRQGSVTGTVARRDSDTIEVTTATGSVSVKLSGNTAIRKTVEATAADITPGQSVLVQGQRNPDGSLAAASIQIGTAGGSRDGR
ncbi:MAG TPA: DUF5666 domain-containing protein [Dehalococcoidia bacterium]|nr:DUF5666 domain-containing protein [Dehalococcoidia bacterium]HLB29360.1 DUF5666 domain-containing protein [Dehalococcoidia bacterium]